MCRRVGDLSLCLHTVDYHDLLELLFGSASDFWVVRRVRFSSLVLCCCSDFVYLVLCVFR